jgi:hypothetical protein
MAIQGARLGWTRLTLMCVFLLSFASQSLAYDCTTTADCNYKGCGDVPCSGLHGSSKCINGVWEHRCYPYNGQYPGDTSTPYTFRMKGCYYGDTAVAGGNFGYCGAPPANTACSTNTTTTLTGTWSQVTLSGHVPGSSQGHGVATVDTFMFIFGGVRSGGRSNRLDRIDTTSGVCTTLGAVAGVMGTAPSERSDMGFASWNRILYVFGGLGGFQDGVSSDGSLIMSLNDLHAFDTTRKTWVHLNSSTGVSGTPPSKARYMGFTAHNNFLWVTFGWEMMSNPGADAHKYDISSKTWSVLSSAPPSLCQACGANTFSAFRYSHSQANLGGLVFTFGGVDQGGGHRNDIRTLEMGNSSATWTSPITCDIPEGRIQAALVAVGHKLILFGGRDHTRYYNDVAFFYPTTNQWHTVTNVSGEVPTARSSFGNAVVVGCSIFIYGGQTQVAEPKNYPEYSCVTKLDCNYDGCSNSPCSPDDQFPKYCVDDLLTYDCRDGMCITAIRMDGAGYGHCPERYVIESGGTQQVISVQELQNRMIGRSDQLFQLEVPRETGEDENCQSTTKPPSSTTLSAAATNPAILCDGETSPFFLAGDTFCVPNNLYPAPNVSHCVFENTWQDVRKDNYFYKTGGLGKMMRDGWEVWVCMDHPCCANKKDKVCFTYNEVHHVFAPWGYNSHLHIFKL